MVVKYDNCTSEWFLKNPSSETTVVECVNCGLFYKPSLGHKCKECTELLDDPMKERLTELLSPAVADVITNKIGITELVDYLLGHGVLVPPCKLGDTVYRVVTMGTGVTYKKAGYNTYRESQETIKRFVRCVTVTQNNFFDVCKNFRRTVFPNREEAQQALKAGVKK